MKKVLKKGKVRREEIVFLSQRYEQSTAEAVFLQFNCEMVSSCFSWYVLIASEFELNICTNTHSLPNFLEVDILGIRIYGCDVNIWLLHLMEPFSPLFMYICIFFHCIKFILLLSLISVSPCDIFKYVFKNYYPLKFKYSNFTDSVSF